MNTLQLAPLGVKAPPGPTGGYPVAEAASTPAKAKVQSLPAASSYGEQQQRLAEARASTARATAERKAKAEAAAAETAAPEAPAPVDTLDRKVGLVDGTFQVFVDLVKPPGDKAVFRVFGPAEHVPPAPAPRTSVAASNAYTREPAVPLKDLGSA